jgi:3-hydroxyisobutyrate dehydrogenase
MKRIAFFGLGNMGVGIAGNLIKAGYQLTIYNRSLDKAKPFLERGASIAGSPAEAARSAEAIVSVVGDDAASKAMWLGPDGALAAAPAGCIFVECSTLSIAWIEELNTAAKARSCHLVEAGLGGGPGVAAAGTINLFCGGDPEVFKRVQPVLAAFSKEQFVFGPTGTGMVYKLINNMMIDVQVSALAEGLALASRSGIDMDIVEKAIGLGSISSPVVKMKVADIRRGRFEPVSFALKWMRKDAHYMKEYAKGLGQETPVADAARGLLDRAYDSGLADKDWTVLSNVLQVASR